MMSLTEAWELWDETPKDPVATNRKEAALEAEALFLGMNPTKLHDEITDLRRLGLTVHQAVREINTDRMRGWHNSNA